MLLEQTVAKQNSFFSCTTSETKYCLDKYDQNHYYIIQLFFHNVLINVYFILYLLFYSSLAFNIYKFVCYLL